jgi:hypothetical protein
MTAQRSGKVDGNASRRPSAADIIERRHLNPDSTAA